MGNPRPLHQSEAADRLFVVGAVSPNAQQYRLDDPQLELVGPAQLQQYRQRNRQIADDRNLAQQLAHVERAARRRSHPRQPEQQVVVAPPSERALISSARIREPAPPVPNHERQQQPQARRQGQQRRQQANEARAQRRVAMILKT